MTKSQKRIFVCTTYVVYYTTIVGQSYPICGILYHICGILYQIREFPRIPYTDRSLRSSSVGYLPGSRLLSSLLIIFHYSLMLTIYPVINRSIKATSPWPSLLNRTLLCLEKYFIMKASGIKVGSSIVIACPNISISIVSSCN